MIIQLIYFIKKCKQVDSLTYQPCWFKNNRI